MPVPIAVAPRLTSRNSATASPSRATSSLMVAWKPSNSWPSVIGTASMSCVRPIFSTSANSTALPLKA